MNWHRAGDVAANCLIAAAAGIWLGFNIWLWSNLAYMLLDKPVDPLFTWIMGVQ